MSSSPAPDHVGSELSTLTGVGHWSCFGRRHPGTRVDGFATGSDRKRVRAHLMSGENKDARRVFDAGVLSLGIAVDGMEVERDIDYAAMAFKRATEYDPDMCDAWLGRVAAG